MLSYLLLICSSFLPLAYDGCESGSCSIPLPTEKAEVTISEIVGKGNFIILSDGSVWAIANDDRPIAEMWLTPANITVESSKEEKYPNLLTNEDTKSSVHAKKSSLAEVYAFLEEEEQFMQQQKAPTLPEINRERVVPSK